MVLVCNFLQKKVESKAVLLDFCRQRKLLVGSENVVKASVGSTEENPI